MSSRLQNLIVVLGLIVIAGLGYYLYTQNQSGVLLPGSDTISTQTTIESADFLRRLNELKNISFDDSIFADPRFQSFINHRSPIFEEGVGRDNPFLEVETE